MIGKKTHIQILYAVSSTHSKSDILYSFSPQTVRSHLRRSYAKRNAAQLSGSVHEKSDV